MVWLIRNLELLRHRRIGFRKICRTVDQLPNQILPIASHSVNEFLGKETRRLRQPKVDMSSAHLIHSPQEGLIFFGSEVLVELPPQEGNHVECLPGERTILTCRHPERSKNAHERGRLL